MLAPRPKCKEMPEIMCCRIRMFIYHTIYTIQYLPFVIYQLLDTTYCMPYIKYHTLYTICYIPCITYLSILYHILYTTNTILYHTLFTILGPLGPCLWSSGALRLNQPCTSSCRSSAQILACSWLSEPQKIQGVL